MKLAIIVGHNPVKQGAQKVDTNATEFDFNERLSHQLQGKESTFGLETKVFLRKPGMGYSKEIREVYDRVNMWDADASIELHFNASNNPAAHGSEVLTSGTPLSGVLGHAVNASICNAFHLRDRGIHTVAPEERGGKSLVSGRCPAILIEPFFGSNVNDCRKISNLESLADAILAGAAEALKSFPRRNITESRTLTATRKQRRGATVGIGAGGMAAVAVVGDPIISKVVDLSDQLPTISALLLLLALGVFFYLRYQSDQVEAARLDDHEKGIR